MVHDYEGLIALLIPVAFFVCLLGATALTLRFRTTKERERHETLRRMVEKGMELPPELLVAPVGRPASDLRRGLVLVGLGVGLIVLILSAGHAQRYWAVGLIPALMGGGYLVTWRLSDREGPSRAGAPLA
jgi:hypothetical protein